MNPLRALLTEEDQAQALAILGSLDRPPDLVIAPDGEPYIYRWHVIPRNAAGANVYFHIQVADDPERPLHDHPWDNQSVILAGGYLETWNPWPQSPGVPPAESTRIKGDVVQRHAETAHRLELLDNCPYTMTLFTTGPVRRNWGFWAAGEFLPHDLVIENRADGTSVYTGPQS